MCTHEKEGETVVYTGKETVSQSWSRKQRTNKGTVKTSLDSPKICLCCIGYHSAMSKRSRKIRLDFGDQHAQTLQIGTLQAFPSTLGKATVVSGRGVGYPNHRGSAKRILLKCGSHVALSGDRANATTPGKDAKGNGNEKLERAPRVGIFYGTHQNR